MGGVVASTAASQRGEAAAVGAATYASDRSAAPHVYGGGAFTTLEVDTAHDRDARATLEKALALQGSAAAALEAGVKLYRGAAAYGNFIAKDAASAVVASKVSGTMGPLRAPTNVRGICRIDYQPDVCKDYKETGFCGFGDSCIFLHDRSDYKMGWQLDKEWEEDQKKKAAALAARIARGGGAEDADAADAAAGDGSDGKPAADTDGLPFACYICRAPFSRPVVTQCGHYFCEACALKRFATDATCAVCGKGTHGIYNTATKLAAKLARRAADDDSAGATASGGSGGGGWSTAGGSSSGSGGWAVVNDDTAAAAVAAADGAGDDDDARSTPRGRDDAPSPAPAAGSDGGKVFIASFGVE